MYFLYLSIYLLFTIKKYSQSHCESLSYRQTSEVFVFHNTDTFYLPPPLVLPLFSIIKRYNNKILSDKTNVFLLTRDSRLCDDMTMTWVHRHQVFRRCHPRLVSDGLIFFFLDTLGDHVNTCTSHSGVQNKDDTLHV